MIFSLFSCHKIFAQNLRVILTCLTFYCRISGFNIALANLCNQDGNEQINIFKVRKKNFGKISYVEMVFTLPEKVIENGAGTIEERL